MLRVREDSLIRYCAYRLMAEYLKRVKLEFIITRSKLGEKFFECLS